MLEINLPPFAPTLMESTRALGYSLESAIADLLDNSISAGARAISIRFWPYDDPFVSILDDGGGMLSEELTAAMRYGSGNPLDIRAERDLGRFGLGLKTASLSQCRCLTVISLKDGLLSGRRWDLDVVRERGQWTLLVLDQTDMAGVPDFDKLSEQGHGTLVVWTDLDRVVSGASSAEAALGNQMDVVRQHIALVFHRYLSGEPPMKKLTIKMNGVPVQANDPFLLGRSDQITDTETITVEGYKISITPFLLPHVSRLTVDELRALGGEAGLRRQQGFYVYRSRRLLVWGTWFRIARQDEFSKLARVRVDIPNALDHLWAIDIRKSRALPPEIVRQNLARVVSKITGSSKRTWTFRVRKETDDSIFHLWDRVRTREGIRYNINRDYPLVEQLSYRLQPAERRILDRLITLLEACFPRNSLYSDMVNDERIAVDDRTTARELETFIRALLVEVDVDGVEQFLTVLEKSEPFINHPDVLQAIRLEVVGS